MGYIKPKNPTSFIIKKKVISVEKLVGQRNKFKNIALKEKIKFTENLRRTEKEEDLEKYKDKESKTKGFTTPRLGFLDFIKNFLFNVLFGALALKLLPHLPQLKGVLITTLKIGNFAIEFAGTILNAMVTFVDKVYGIIDFGKQQIKLLGGEKAVKSYENMLGTSNKVINAVLIAGMLFSDLIVTKAQVDSNQSAVGDIGKEVTEEIVKRQGFRAAIQNAGRMIGNFAKGAGVVLLVGLASSILGELTFQLRKFTKKLQNDVAYLLKEAESDKNPITKVLKLITYNAALPGLKFFNFAALGLGTLLDIIGAPFRYLSELVNLGIMSLTGDAEGIKQQRENLGKFDARIREQIREYVNTLSLGTLAKEKGSFGSLYGTGATKAMGYASGGAVTREGEEAIGGVIGRTLPKKAASRTIEIPMSPLNPGSDAGGKMTYVNPTTKNPTETSNIETFFPNPEDPKYVSPYSYLTNSYSIASSGEFLKPFLQMPIKMIMGDGSSEGDYTSLAAAVNNLFVNILGRTLVPGKKTSLADELGPIDILSWAANSIKESMIIPVSDLIKSLKNQFMLKSGGVTGKVNPSAQKGDGAGDNPLAEFAGQAQFVIGDSIAHGFAGRSGDGSDSEDTMKGRSAANVLKILKLRGDKLKGMLIDLSTGIANSPEDYKSVEEQLSYLKSMGARVRVLGVGNPFSKKNNGINEKLDQMVKSNGFYFYGGYKGATDGVHGTPKDYSDLKAKHAQETIATKKTDNFSNIKGKGSAIYLHWTAGGYYGVSGNYHTTVTGDGKINRTTPYDKFNVGHTERRNSNAVGLSVAAMGGSPDPWSVPVKSIQYQKMAEEAAKIAKAWGWTSSDINIKNVMTHAEAGSNKDGGNRHSNYGPQAWGGTGERWDLYQLYKNDAPGSGGDKIRGMIKGMMFEGGYIKQTGNYLTHPGEYVVDADSVKFLGINFYDIINETETAFQRKNASESLISILEQYTEDGFVESEDDYTYQVPAPKYIYIPGQVVPIGSSGSGGGGNGDTDPSLDGLELR